MALGGKTWKWALVGTSALTLLGASVTDWSANRTSVAVPEIHKEDHIVIDRLVPEIDEAGVGSVVTVRMRKKGGTEERVARVVAVQGTALKYEGGKLFVDKEVFALPAKPAPSPPRRLGFKGKGLGGYVKAAVDKESKGVPQSLGLEEKRVPRHHAYVIYEDPDKPRFLRGALVPLGDVVGVVRVAFRLPDNSGDLHIHAL